jgi:GTP cyclohydrolase II
MKHLSVERKVCARIPNEHGEFQLCLYTNNLDDKEHLALVLGDVHEMEKVLVRVHSECFTGDVLGSRRCDCGDQLQQAMQLVAEEGAGVIVYLRQEGRGIGLAEKLRAYNLQDEGYDTVEANLVLGHEADERDYSIAAHILQDLGVRSVRLLTNNPDKIRRLDELGIPVVERIALESAIHPDNAFYLFTKAQRMNHLLDLALVAVPAPNGNGNGKNGSH